MNMGARIKALLQERGWKQSQLLERVPEMDAKALSALIKRDSRFSEYALGIAQALGVSLDYLIFGVGTQPESTQSSLPHNLNAADVCELLALYGACDEAGRDFVKAAARTRIEIAKASSNKRKSGG